MKKELPQKMQENIFPRHTRSTSGGWRISQTRATENQNSMHTDALQSGGGLGFSVARVCEIVCTFGQCLSWDCYPCWIAALEFDAYRRFAEGYQTRYTYECLLHSKNAILGRGKASNE